MTLKLLEITQIKLLKRMASSSSKYSMNRKYTLYGTVNSNINHFIVMLFDK